VAKIHIARCAAAQFTEGDTLHWWYNLPGVRGLRGVRTRYADDYLWLPYICGEYVKATGDAAFLATKIPFLEGEPLAAGQADRYAEYFHSGRRGALYEHCLRAVERALGLLGVHGLPLMQGGDWNDGMNQVGAGGRGESVWLGMFLVMVLDNMASLCKLEKEPALAERFLGEAAVLRERLDQHAWAGDHYIRAFWDDGEPLNTVDLLPQAFAALCAMPNQQRVNQALNTAMAQLVDEDNHMIKLLAHPFEHGAKRAGYINEYPPGIRENGGQYTHAAVWLCLALARAGRQDEARRLLQLLNPAQFCQNPETMERYGGEPYALAGDVSAAPGALGRAGWTLYTGSAAWFLICARALWPPAPPAA
jgi:cyclic beta-1,2-glucan synthetase